MTTHQEPIKSVHELIGETPLVQVQAASIDVPVYAKLEMFNPGGSVKDRIGKYILEQLLRRGELEIGGKIVEPTAGNTGIGMAIAAQQLDLDAIFVVPEKFSSEKQKLMTALGGKIVHTSTEDGMAGAINRAYQIATELENAVVPQQFSNPLNAAAHYATTAPEIYNALDDCVGAIVVGCGTGGTLMGLARYAIEQNPETYIIAVEPEGSLFASILGAPVEAAEYTIEGIGTHEQSTVELFDPSIVNEVVQVSDRAAHEEITRLAREEGHLVGSSAGAASVAALRVAQRIVDGEVYAPYETVVTVFPDSSERYLSKNIYGTFEEWNA